MCQPYPCYNCCQSAVQPLTRAVQLLKQFNQCQGRYNCPLDFLVLLYLVRITCVPFRGLVYSYFPMLGPSISSLCAGGSSSRGGARGNRKKHARRDKQPIEGAEVTAPTKSTRRQKSLASKQRLLKPLNTLSEKDFAQLHHVNPYENPRKPDWLHPEFWFEIQERIYNEVCASLKTKFVKKITINVQHMREHADYFGNALTICTELDLIKLMEFNYDFDVSLVAQFLATVHFGIDEARTLTWMTRDELFIAPWKDFCHVLGYGEKGLKDPMGFRPHDRANASDKDVLAPLYIHGRGVLGDSKDL